MGVLRPHPVARPRGQPQHQRLGQLVQRIVERRHRQRRTARAARHYEALWRAVIAARPRIAASADLHGQRRGRHIGQRQTHRHLPRARRLRHRARGLHEAQLRQDRIGHRDRRQIVAGRARQTAVQRGARPRHGQIAKRHRDHLVIALPVIARRRAHLEPPRRNTRARKAQHRPRRLRARQRHPGPARGQRHIRRRRARQRRAGRACQHQRHFGHLARHQRPAQINADFHHTAGVTLDKPRPRCRPQPHRRRVVIQDRDHMDPGRPDPVARPRQERQRDALGRLVHSVIMLLRHGGPEQVVGFAQHRDRPRAREREGRLHIGPRKSAGRGRNHIGDIRRRQQVRAVNARAHHARHTLAQRRGRARERHHRRVRHGRVDDPEINPARQRHPPAARHWRQRDLDRFVPFRLQIRQRLEHDHPARAPRQRHHRRARLQRLRPDHRRIRPPHKPVIRPRHRIARHRQRKTHRLPRIKRRLRPQNQLLRRPLLKIAARHTRQGDPLGAQTIPHHKRRRVRPRPHRRRQIGVQRGIPAVLFIKGDNKPALVIVAIKCVRDRPVGQHRYPAPRAFKAHRIARLPRIRRGPRIAQPIDQ